MTDCFTLPSGELIESITGYNPITADDEITFSKFAGVENTAPRISRAYVLDTVNPNLKVSKVFDKKLSDLKYSVIEANKKAGLRFIAPEPKTGPVQTYRMYVPRTDISFYGTYGVHLGILPDGRYGELPSHRVGNCYTVNFTDDMFLVRNVRTLEHGIDRLKDVYTKMFEKRMFNGNKPDELFELNNKFGKYFYIDLQRYRQAVRRYGFKD